MERWIYLNDLAEQISNSKGAGRARHSESKFTRPNSKSDLMTKFWKPLLAIALICALALAGLDWRRSSRRRPRRSGRTSSGCLGSHGVPPGLPQPGHHRPGGSQAGRRRDLQGCVDMGMNAGILQVRPSADALSSELYPWSKYLTGTQEPPRKTALIRWPTGWSGPMPRGWSSTPGSIPSASPRGRGGVPVRPPTTRKSPPRLGGGAARATTSIPACPRCGYIVRGRELARMTISTASTWTTTSTPAAA